MTSFWPLPPEVEKERRQVLGEAIKDAVKQHRNSRLLADAVLGLVEAYRKADRELRTGAFKEHLASFKPEPRRKPWSSRNSKSYRDG
jgi:hypothetical protein